MLRLLDHHDSGSSSNVHLVVRIRGEAYQLSVECVRRFELPGDFQMALAAVKTASSTPATQLKNAIIALCGTMIVWTCIANLSNAQTLTQVPYSCYRLVPQTVYEQQTVTGYKWVNETQYEQQTVKSYKPVWTTEQRERTYKVLKPVLETSEREERQVVYKPYYEIKYEEQTIQRTEWETVTEMREERRLVRKPISETQFKDELITVRRPVTQTVMEQHNVTTLRPVTTTQTVLTPTLTPTNRLLYAPGNVRNRLQWLRRGYYPDTSGLLGYRTGGLYWVPQQNLGSYQVQTGYTPSFVAQQLQQTSYIPETTTVQRPVQRTTYVEETQTRRVPVTVQKYTEEILIRQVPVTVQRAVTKHYLKRTPIQTLKYATEVVTRKVPVTRQTFVEEIRTEPYSVHSCRWEEVISTVQVPRLVTRRVPTQLTQLIPRTTLLSVPVDMFGNPVYSGIPLQQQVISSRPIITQNTVAPRQTYYATPQITTVPTPGRSVIVGPSELIQITPESEMVAVEKRPTEEMSAKKDQAQGNEDSKSDDNAEGGDAADKRPELSDEQNGNQDTDSANGDQPPQERVVEGEVERESQQKPADNDPADHDHDDHDHDDHDHDDHDHDDEAPVNLIGPELPERDVDAERGEGA